MRPSVIIVLAAALAAGLLQPATANPSRSTALETPSAFARVYRQVAPPYGFVQFCETVPRECAGDRVEDSRLQATPERLSELDEVNRLVNHVIAPATDLDLYGVTEHWTIPTAKGDCEDYALLKRKILIARGWPVGAVLMTVVRDEKGEGHAVLTVRTAQGDFILDNKAETVKVWHQTPYDFIMRQSFINPKVWVSLDRKEDKGPALLSGVRSAR